ncbi:MAG: metalloregulator ArsR/SmtB family transcription factor [Dehalococcoidia bacterium]|nr:MAG: metalloregulator ArsR/SmtB family transcription factor [Dehalococcoidia bacterium]
MRELIKVFKALSDETRMRMLKLLSEGELCVCEIMQAMEISQSRASRNLGILKEAGLLKDRRDGQWVHYSLNKEGTAYYSTLLELLNNSLNDDKTILKDKENLRRAIKPGLR